jgi:hypothetical protein
MQAGPIGRPWDMADVVQVVEEWEANQKVAQRSLLLSRNSPQSF